MDKVGYFAFSCGFVAIGLVVGGVIGGLLTPAGVWFSYAVIGAPVGALSGLAAASAVILGVRMRRRK